MNVGEFVLMGSPAKLVSFTRLEKTRAMYVSFTSFTISSVTSHSVSVVEKHLFFQFPNLWLKEGRKRRGRWLFANNKTRGFLAVVLRTVIVSTTTPEPACAVLNTLDELQFTQQLGWLYNHLFSQIRQLRQRETQWPAQSHTIGLSQTTVRRLGRGS